MAQNQEIAIPIVCGNEECQNFDRTINTISEITDVDLFYESYGHGGEEAEDYCPKCGWLGIAEDYYFYSPEKEK